MSEKNKITKTSLRQGKPADPRPLATATPGTDPFDNLENLDLSETVENILFDVTSEHPHHALEKPRNPLRR